MDGAIVLLFDSAATQAVCDLCNRLRPVPMHRIPAVLREYPHLTLLQIPSGSRETAWSTVLTQDFSQLGPVLLSGLSAPDGPGGRLYLDIYPGDALQRLHEELSVRAAAPHSDHWRARVELPDDISPGCVDDVKRGLSTTTAIAAVCEDVVALEFSGTCCTVSDHFVIGGGPSGTIWQGYEEALSFRRYFEAHEILERLWRQEHGMRQQSAIWLAAVFVHWSRGQYPGALKILDKIQGDVRRFPEALAEDLAVWQAALNRRDPLPTLSTHQRLCLVRWARHEPS